MLALLFYVIWKSTCTGGKPNDCTKKLWRQKQYAFYSGKMWSHWKESWKLNEGQSMDEILWFWKNSFDMGVWTMWVLRMTHDTFLGVFNGQSSSQREITSLLLI